MLHLKNTISSLFQHNKLIIDDLTINSHEFGVIVGGNGSGKIAFCSVLLGKIPPYSGEVQNGFKNIALLSFEQ